jgi:hypothetical protein
MVLLITASSNHCWAVTKNKNRTLMIIRVVLKIHTKMILKKSKTQFWYNISMALKFCENIIRSRAIEVLGLSAGSFLKSSGSFRFVKWARTWRFLDFDCSPQRTRTQ